MSATDAYYISNFHPRTSVFHFTLDFCTNILFFQLLASWTRFDACAFQISSPGIIRAGRMIPNADESISGMQLIGFV